MPPPPTPAATDRDSEPKTYKETVEKINRLAFKLYGATAEMELNKAYDELISFFGQPTGGEGKKEKESSPEFIMSGFKALFAIARVTLLQNIELKEKVSKLEKRLEALESKKKSA